MDIPIPAFIQHPERIYHKEILLKRETKKVWTEYYAVLCDRFLIFNMKNAQSGNIIPNNCTILELTPHSRVAYTRKKCYRFPFEVETDKLKYSFKCETSLQRYRWVYSIRNAIEGKPPKPAPKFIPTRKVGKKDEKPHVRPSRTEHRSRLHTFSQSSLNRSHENGFYSNARHNNVDLADEGELNHSSTAVRLQKDKSALLLTNKGAFAEAEASAIAKYQNGHRRQSHADDDLQIVDFDSAEDTDSDTADKSCDSVTANKSRDSVECDTGIGKLNLVDPERITTVTASCDAIEKHVSNDLKVESQSYRLYPDNMKSYSWTSLGILRKSTAYRQHSAPSTSHRYQRHPPKVSFSPNTK